MKFVIQRVKEGRVEIDGSVTASIGRGYLVLIGIAQGDTKEMADKLVRKMVNLRIFEDDQGKTNLSLAAVGGSLLLVSQFTLCADTRHGNRPGFSTAAKPEEAEKLYNYIVDACRAEVPCVETGTFGAEMVVSLANDGPFTILLDSAELM